MSVLLSIALATALEPTVAATESAMDGPRAAFAAFDAVDARLGGERYRFFTRSTEGVSALVETAYRREVPGAKNILCSRWHDLLWQLADRDGNHRAYLSYVCEPQDVWSTLGLARTSTVYVELRYRYDAARVMPLWLGATVDVSPADAPFPTAIVDLTTVELP